MSQGQEIDPSILEAAAIAALRPDRYRPEPTAEQTALANVFASLAISSRLGDIQAELEEAYYQRYEHAVRRGEADA